ncbi:SecDF P1 head subdomain-containing protein [Afifella marina]|uniref:SecDF P1 head subdomain domain-containing protein n=1 Tax=Afifella marina DSM 2698 TaxID=1120955 RepID=A0A1G5MXN4_AFIMA|nr:hypothetical protein [Afifella marina]MBK1622069.1 hypothetical protein [Afifella marina DSM 2698]MBK1627862.1 hypothetical protein [Afifella marina]MBK5918073.1 hypothetical protein [Afifella marina]RAI19848.1 hypothetical protein CH311_11075 [Afifella marina DSM 2698]SCZ29210.1 hypothetical protein SAMN03080610_01100 [Afifella marina DSM 2698]
MRTRQIFAAALLAGLLPTHALADMLALSLAEAETMFNEASQKWEVVIRLDDDSAKAFAQFTQVHLQQQIKVMVDGEVLVTPMIRSPIYGGPLPIGGSESQAKSQDLAERLKSGRAILTVAPAE